MTPARIERRSVTLSVKRSDPPTVRVERKAGARMTIVRNGLGGGAAIAAPLITRIASQAIGGFRVVRVGANNQFTLCDPATPFCADACGVTIGAAAQNAPASAQYSGEISDAAWNWNEGPVFCGAGGLLTQVEPVLGTIVQVGNPTGPQSLRINIIYLADLA